MEVAEAVAESAVEATVEATTEFATKAVMVQDLVVWVRSMEAESVWKAEAAVVTVQRKKMEGGGWFLEAV